MVFSIFPPSSHLHHASLAWSRACVCHRGRSQLHPTPLHVESLGSSIDETHHRDSSIRRPGRSTCSECGPATLTYTRTHPILTERGHARGFASDVECSRLDQAGELARLGDACTGRSTAPRRWPPSARRRRTDIAYIVHRTHLQRSVIVHRIYIVHLLATFYIIHTSLSLDCLSQFGQIYILATNARPRASSIVCAALVFAA